MSRKWRGLAVVAVLVAAACIRLGFWQLDRLEQRRARTAVQLAARNAPPVDLVAGSLSPTLDGRGASAVGTYDRSHEMVIRGAVFEGSPGVRVITPLRLAVGDTAVLVDRGFMPAPDAVNANLAGLDEGGIQLVVGTVEAIVARRDDGEPLVRGTVTSWRGLDLDAVRAAIPYPVAPLLLRQSPDPSLPDRPVRQEPPPPGEGSHLAYAIQWFAFALVALGGAAAAWWTQRRTAGPANRPPD